MKQFAIRTIVALAAFTISLTVHNIESRFTASRLPVASSPTATTELPKCENYYRMGDDERLLGIRHYPIARSDYSNIFARLNEFVVQAQRAPTRTNTFYISNIESQNDCKVA